MNELIQMQSIDSIVSSYHYAVEKIHSAYDELKMARDTISKALGGKDLWHTLAVTMSDNRESVLKSLLESSWRYIIEQTGVKNVMTEKRNMELKAQFRDGDLPEFTFEAVISMLDSLRSDVGTMMRESVKEVFETLRPCLSKYKTNTEFAVGKKAILEYIFYVWKGPTWHDVHFEEDSQTLTTLDNVFHLLDGKGVAKYPTDLKTVVKQTHANKEWKCETEYFKCKWFKKGSFHIEFKRLDLVDELNKIAGGTRLKERAV